MTTEKKSSQISKVNIRYNPGSLLSSCLLLLTEIEVMSTLDGKLLLGLALFALETQDDLLGGLGLLLQDRLGLATETLLLVVITALSLGEVGSLASLVLGDPVKGVLLALLALAICLALLRYGNHLS